MILFISDIHFGRLGPEAERRNEAALIAFLRAQEAETERLYLLGDVFDQYIEYRTLIPKGFVRFQALLASWTDRGLPVTYIVGNHDPWHRDHFERELGVRVVFDHLFEPLYSRNVYMAHGDGLGDRSWYNRLRPWLRHPVPVWLYRSLLPGDAGFALARWVNRRFLTDEVPDEAQIQALRLHARRLLEPPQRDVVVMGHSHRPEHCRWPEGEYLNPGCWYESHTFGRLDENGLKLLRWNGSCSIAVQPSG